MATNDEIFDQLNLSDTEREWVASNASRMDKKGFNKYSDNPKAANLLAAIDGLSTNINSSLSHSMNEGEIGRPSGYGAEDTGALSISGLSSAGLSGQTLENQIIEANLDSSSTISNKGSSDMFLEYTDLNRPKGSVAAQVAGEKRFGEFLIEGTSKDGNRYSFEVYGEPGAYQYRALHGDDHKYYPLSDKQYERWSDQMKAKAQRLKDLPSNPYSSEIRKAWRGPAGTAIPGETTAAATPDKQNIISGIMNKFKGMR